MSLDILFYFYFLVIQVSPAMQGDAETAEEELLRRVKAELEQPVEVEVIQTPISYYHQNKDKVHT